MRAQNEETPVRNALPRRVGEARTPRLGLRRGASYHGPATRRLRLGVGRSNAGTAYGSARSHLRPVVAVHQRPPALRDDRGVHRRKRAVCRVRAERRATLCQRSRRCGVRQLPGPAESLELTGAIRALSAATGRRVRHPPPACAGGTEGQASRQPTTGRPHNGRSPARQGAVCPQVAEGLQLASTIASAQRTVCAGPSNEAKKPSPAVSISRPR
jgi:hypothetical protein